MRHTTQTMKDTFTKWLKRVYWFTDENRRYTAKDMQTAFNAGWRAAIKGDRIQTRNGVPFRN